MKTPDGKQKVVCNDEDARSSVVGMDTSGVDAQSFPLSQTPTLAESGGTASFALASAAPSTVVCNPGRKPYRPAASMKSGDTSDGASHPVPPLRPLARATRLDRVNILCDTSWADKV